MIDTPVNLFNKVVGRYDFTPQAFPSDEQLLVEAITTQLNQMERNDNKVYLSEIQMKKKKSAEQAKKEKSVQQYEEIKLINPMEEI